MNRIFEIINKININGTLLKNVDMSKYTTFKCGGNAEFFIEALDSNDISKVVKASNSYKIPLFILGGGANILVSDKGIPGITLSTKKLNTITQDGHVLISDAGVTVNELCEFALDKSLSGLEFIYGMPGSLGGAALMNARCYGDEISNKFLWAEYIDQNGDLKKINYNKGDWEYKISPFQNKNWIITKVALQLQTGDKKSIKEIMDKNNSDREIKGHFKYPCAGSVFKNNRDFGEPSGKIIQDAGLKGETRGNAQISTFHGNIIVNLGNAKSSDINYLINKTINVIKKQRGFVLEPEVIKVGSWED